MLQSTPDNAPPLNILYEARKFKNFHINSYQRIILSQFCDKFKVIQLPRFVGGTTALLLGGIIRLEHGLDTDILTDSPSYTAFKLSCLLNLLSPAGMEEYTAYYQGHELRIRSEFDNRYTLVDTPFPPFCINQGLALDNTGRWSTTDYDFVRIQ